jgi:hypothetical protein
MMRSKLDNIGPRPWRSIPTISTPKSIMNFTNGNMVSSQTSSY